MNRKIIFIFTIFILFIYCEKVKTEIKTPHKIEQIYAENNYGMFGKIKLTVYSDSSYTCVKYETSPNYEKTEKFDGFFKIKNDTINFFPSDFKLNYSTKAIVKNNFVEFVDGQYPLKIEIKKNTLKAKNQLNFNKIKDYAFFTFNKKYHSPIYYGYKPNTIMPYDIKQSEFEELNGILKKCFSENKSKLKGINNYVKQCIVVKNDKQEIEV